MVTNSELFSWFVNKRGFSPGNPVSYTCDSIQFLSDFCVFSSKHGNFNDLVKAIIATSVDVK
jgi:hypothetical protein